MSGPSHRLITLIFFAAVTLLYLSFSPFSEAGMGYIGEEMTACRQIGARLTGTGGTIEWPRNGVVGLVFQCPFLAAGDALLGASTSSEDVGLSLQPVLATALLVTLIFAWGSRLAQSRAWGFCVALAAGFATFLWPYAYIGLETTQSLFLFLAGYLALDRATPPTWTRSLLFGVAAGVAISAKSGGILLLPAVGYLFWCLFFRGRERPAPGRLWRSFATLLVIGAIFLANSYVRNISWTRFGGMTHFASYWLVHDAITPFLNLIAVLASPNKGLIVYAPFTLLAAVSLPRAWAVDRRIVVFALLTLFGFAGSLSLLEMWSDETWGPRYLHSAIAPLALCLAASRRSRPLTLRREAPLGAAVALGLAVSFLGAAFYYGSLMNVATSTRPLTMQALQGETTWNHVRFNARLLRIWLDPGAGSGAPQYVWPPRLWDFTHPKLTQVWNNVDLRPYAWPQPVLLRWAASPRGHLFRRALAAAWLAGVALLAWVFREVRSERALSDA